MPENEAFNFIITMRAREYEIVSKTDDNSGVAYKTVLQSAKTQEQNEGSLERATDKGRQIGQKKDYKEKTKQHNTRRGPERTEKEFKKTIPNQKIG